MKPIIGKVLVVDDDRRNLAAIGEILKDPVSRLFSRDRARRRCAGC